jgi:hypothetical protein
MDLPQVLSIQGACLADEPAAGGVQLPRACSEWRLDADAAGRFFALATEYPQMPTQGFYQLPCSIEGVVQADGKRWDFSINAAGTAVWKSGDVTRYFGCSTAACAPLVLLMPDNGEP